MQLADVIDCKISGSGPRMDPCGTPEIVTL